MKNKIRKHTVAFALKLGLFLSFVVIPVIALKARWSKRFIPADRQDN